MKFKIDDFIVNTNKGTEQLNDKIAVPTRLSSGKPSGYEWEYKKRDITVFNSLDLQEKKDGKYYRVITDLFNFIDLIEILKAFSSNKLNTNKKYIFNNKFTAKTAQKDGNITLEIYFRNYSYSLYLDKFECSNLAAKFSKILSRCETWQEQVQ